MVDVTVRAEIVENFYRLRRILGYLGFLLPAVLILGDLPLGGVTPSISDFYHTLLRDIYVGILTAIGIFLLCYTGFRPKGSDRISDDVITTIAGIAALVVAFVPNKGTLNTSWEPEALTQHLFGVWGAEMTHHVAALTLLLCLAYLSYFRFARTAQAGRRRTYVICAWVILLATVMTFLVAWFRKYGSEEQAQIVLDYRLVFWFEAIGFWAFSVSWLVKGRTDLSVLRRARADQAEGRGNAK